MLLAIQQQADQRCVHLQLMVPHFVEHTFDTVGKTDHSVKTEQSGRAFDGVGGTENSCNVVVRRGVATFDIQQAGFHHLQ